MICKQHDLSVRKQCELVQIPRSMYYYEAKRQVGLDGILMNEIQERWLEKPFYGYRRITNQLRESGYEVNRKRIYRIMRQMNLQAIYPKPRLSRNGKQYVKYPYLLNDLKVTHPNQVWMTDITYIPIPGGFLYLVAIIDVYSRYVVAWKLSNSLDSGFCLSMLEEAFKKGKPEILNSDQGCQFTSETWIYTVEKEGVQISMDGKGRCIDNIYIERFWRALKYEDLYVNPPQTVKEAKQTIRQYIHYYNAERGHQSLQYKVPAELYYKKTRKGLMETVDNSDELPTVSTVCNKNKKIESMGKRITRNKTHSL